MWTFEIALLSEDFKREDVASGFLFASLQDWAYTVCTTKRAYPEVSTVVHLLTALYANNSCYYMIDKHNQWGVMDL